MSLGGDGAPVIEARALTKVYRGGVRALDGLDLLVRPGELVGFLGPNGAGKTTTVQLLIGAVRPTGGSATVLGRPAGDRLARRGLGYLPEQFQFPGFLTPPGLLDFHGRLLGLPRDERRRRAAELIRIVGLEAAADRPLKSYSKGMLQRVGLAQALLGRPALLLLDEPTSGLDPIGTRNVRDLLLWLKSQGVAVLLNSHLLSEVELVCDRVAIIDRGRVVAEGRLGEIVRPSTSVRIRAADLDEAGLAALRALSSELVAEGEGQWRAEVDSPEAVPRIAAAVVGAGARLEALVPAHETLEQAFLRLVGAAPDGAAAAGQATPGPRWGIDAEARRAGPAWGRSSEPPA
ncbi:MAG TPA: ABC transporter ATP-binding protein [Candidatus Limnocylindrales bacterium]|nr:ABC transporter ATP-binding protein [Candidatus Limnocylindrales bacterium]